MNINLPLSVGAGGVVRRLPLAGDWQFRRVGDEAWTPAVVPGSNFSDLLRAGAIEDPYLGDAELRLQWVEREDWEYRCRFDVTAADLSANRVDLVFDGLDTHCEVRLNGVWLFTGANMFRTYRDHCRALLREGANELHLVFRSPVVLGAARSAADGFVYPAENDKTPERTSVHSRKAPYHFGWDWGPKYVTAGVWRPAYLEVIDTARIECVDHRIVSIDDDRAELQLTVAIDAAHAGQATVTVGGETPGVAPVSTDIAFPAGISEHRLTLTIDSPQRWWPNGLGDPFLYRLVVSLDTNGRPIDERRIAVGLRTIEVVNQPDEHGQSFYLMVNGHPVFMKGANYIPPDSFLETMTEGRYRQLFADAVDANMNMLRVWGGGVYECDLFYDLADEHGILVWQDFMFACTLYPSDPDFFDEVSHEAIDAIRRLRGHACLALWCGNNEISLGIAHWEWPEKFGYSPELYERLVAGNGALFDDLLPSLVARHDPERFYFASSPIGFWNDPADDAKGDGHYWGVWHGELPFDTYRDRVTRFMSEYGFQSYPMPSSIARFVAPADRNVGSPQIAVHQKHPRGDAIMSRFVEQHYGRARDFDAFCYLTQLVQAEGLRVAFEAHRQAMPFCMGTLYWQLNDCWPSISWSSIDYFGQWKALHYQARRSFAPLVVSVAPDGDGFAIFGVSDLLVERGGRLSARLVDFAGVELWRRDSDVRVPARQSIVLDRIASGDLPAATDLNAAALVVTLTDGDGAVIASDRRLLVLPSACVLPDPGLSLTIVGATTVEVAANRYAHAVHVAASAVDASVINFDDNFFDLLPGERRTITTRGGVAFDPASLSLMSAWDACERAGPGATAGALRE